MKFQLVTAAAAFLVASAAALPAPQPDNHGLVPDADDGPIELMETRDITDTDDLVDDSAIEVLETRTDAHGLLPDTDDWEDDEDVTIEVLETRATSDATPDAVEELETRDISGTEVLEARAKTVSAAAANFNFTADFDFALDRLLVEIDEIPDEVLKKGDAALHQWLVEHGDRSGSEKLKRDAEDEVDYENLSLFERGELVARASWWKIAKCVAAVVQLLATTAVPAAKLLRIKSYIKALGGAKEAVKLMLGATTKAEKLKAGGEALVMLSAELLGISTVKNNCF